MKYQTLLTNIKRGLNVMYFITRESGKSVINDEVFDNGRINGMLTDYNIIWGCGLI